MKSMLLPGAACLLAGVALTGAARAQFATGGDVPSAPAAFVALPVDTATLEGYRGGAQFASNDMTLDGTTADNSAHHIVTGTNTIQGGAFANMNGLPVVIQNSGANVLIQNATIVHIEMN